MNNPYPASVGSTAPFAIRQASNLRGSLLKRRVKDTILALRSELRAYLYTLVGSVKIAFAFDPGADSRIEFGAGSTHKVGYRTSDLTLSSDYPWDLTFGCPFPTETLEAVYCEHLMEHFCYRHVTMLLKEFHRALKPGGTLRIVVPNASIYLNAYQHAESFPMDRYYQWPWLPTPTLAIDIVNYMFYMDGQHKYMYDRENLTALLKAAGFARAEITPFDPELDKPSRQHESLYVLATK